MNNNTALNIARIVLVVLLQILILNNINLFGYINPYYYIIFIFIYPFKNDRVNLFILSFIIGIIIDWFSNTGGIHASATLLIAFIRRPILAKITNKSEVDLATFNIYTIGFGKSLFYIGSLSFIHAFSVYLLDSFSFQNFDVIIIRTFLSSIFTSVLIFMGIIIFTKRQ